ncbi:hypothetical protein NCCP28_36660 [Niallia sp. NCCP-28]|nr:hypothetical protein NCCP28_36660 [Niallia sp. NCCP-28]
MGSCWIIICLNKHHASSIWSSVRRSTSMPARYKVNESEVKMILDNPRRKVVKNGCY